MTFGGSSVTMRKSGIATTFDGLPRLRATTQYRPSIPLPIVIDVSAFLFGIARGKDQQCLCRSGAARLRGSAKAIDVWRLETKVEAPWPTLQRFPCVAVTTSTVQITTITTASCHSSSCLPPSATMLRIRVRPASC